MEVPFEAGWDLEEVEVGARMRFLRMSKLCSPGAANVDKKRPNDWDESVSERRKKLNFRKFDPFVEGWHKLCL
ncbi:MAG TPA: hypothetical protein VK956_12900 [Verrucomicrobium sp.]|nr:hypothetical protein [Verrucomicrobium sp.]